MKKCFLAMVTLMLLSTGAWAQDAAPPSPPPSNPGPARPTTVGGGIPNPWRNPYRTAVRVQVIRE